MKKSVFCVTCALLFGMSVSAQKLNEMVNFERYEGANKEMAATPNDGQRVIFIGNSITQGWADQRPDFFASNRYIGRGIGGQTSPQLLLRFRQDVIDLKPAVVIINIGTNDVAQNTGTYRPDFTLGNIKSMAEIAKANGIKVILSSVLPAGGFRWNKEITDAPAKIDALNREIERYAKENKLPYIDYNTSMRKSDGSMIDSYSYDGVHPTNEAYAVMEVLAKQMVDQVLKK